MKSVQKPKLTNSVLWLMAIASGLVAANIYYNQPLLSLIAKEFKTSEAAISKVAMLTQIGYATGLFLIVPLGDMVKRKRLIVIDFVLMIISLVAVALSPNLIWLCAFSFLTGLSSVVPQLFVPMAASLAQPEKRAQSIGLVMSGLLVGILGSRILSGWMGTLYGWRSVFYLAAATMFILWIIIIRMLPDVVPQYKDGYTKLIKSIGHFAKTEPLLQAAALRGALIFASFSAFWTALTFLLNSPAYNAGSAVAGSFGFVGILGALMAAFVGRLAKRFSLFNLTTGLITLFIFSWFVFWLFGIHYAGLVVGIIILDVAVQGTHIMNQTSIFSIKPEANNRLNTVYMTSYFMGGATGTFLAGTAWQYAGWNGVIVTGMGLGLLALLAHFYYKKLYVPTVA